MAAKKVEELRSAGNQYITSKPPQYEKAIEAYTEALSVDPSHHAILSNRSLAYYKLARYEDALADAEKTVLVSPKWAKGFLRKCAALNALKRNAEAKTVAEIGFQLMHSTSFCREFVSQWLEACESLYSVEKLPSLLPYGEADLCRVMIIHWLRFREESNVGKDVGFLPDGLVILSEQYWKVFFRCLASRTSPVLSVYMHDLMQQHLYSIAEDFEKIAGLFGQRVGTVIKEWVEAIATQVDCAVLVQLSARASEKSSHLVSFLDSDFHTTLYPLARSLLALAVTVVATRVYMLNSSSTGFDSISYMLQACLWLFERSILSTKEYTGLHLKVLTGLVDSYNRRYKPISHSECAQLAKYCKSIESLLPVYATSCALEYQQMSEAYQQIVATAKGLILARQTGTAFPFQGLSDEPQEMSIASALRDVEKYPAQVKSFATDHLQEIVNKPPSMLSISDGQDLLQLTGRYTSYICVHLKG